MAVRKGLKIINVDVFQTLTTQSLRNVIKPDFHRERPIYVIPGTDLIV